MKFIATGLVLALTISGMSARGARVVSTDGWCQYSNGDFTVVSQMSPAKTAAWAGRLKNFMTAMKGRLPGDPRLLGPYTLVLFSKAGDFWNSAPTLDTGDPLTGIAAFSRAGSWGATSATCDQGSTEVNQRLIFQGTIQWMLSSYRHPMPNALKQGLKEVYGAYAIEGRRQIFGRPPRDWTSDLQVAANHPLSTNGRYLTVEDLLSHHDVNELAQRHGASIFSEESWGFTHFLLFSKDMAKQHAFDRLLQAFARRATAHDALQIAFGDGADTINSRFLNYLQGGDFYEVATPIERAPVPGASVTPADPEFAATTLAKLEVSAGHLEVARAYAEQASGLAANDPKPQDALSLVDFVSDRHAAAAADCAAAIRLGSRDGWNWYLASLEVVPPKDGSAARGGADRLDPAQAREAINDAEKAIIYSRGLQPAYERVAALIPAADHVTEDDGKFLALGAELLPNSGWIDIGRAQWARRVHDDALALKIIDDVLAQDDVFPPGVMRQARTLRHEWTPPSS